jgi:hypothetical protein
VVGPLGSPRRRTEGKKADKAVTEPKVKLAVPCGKSLANRPLLGLRWGEPIVLRPGDVGASPNLSSIVNVPPPTPWDS